MLGISQRTRTKPKTSRSFTTRLCGRTRAKPKTHQFLTLLKLDISTITSSISYTSMADQTSSREKILPCLQRSPYSASNILTKAWSVMSKSEHIVGEASNISLDNKYGTKKDVGKMTSQVQDKSIGFDLNKYVELDEVFNLEEHRVSSSSSILDKAWYIITQEYEDMKDLLMLKKYGKKTSQLQDKFTDCNLNKYEEPFSQDKRKETVQRFISCLIATVVFFWIIFDTCTHSSIIQLQPLHNQHSPIFKWFFLLELIYIVVLVSLVAVSIVVSAPFSRMHSAMLVFWAILMLIKSAQSITEVYVPILGILFTGCYMFVEKQPELPN